MVRMAHPDGECAIARGCAAEGLIQVVRLSPFSYTRAQGLLPLKTSSYHFNPFAWILCET